jgi:hypothetical protein
LDARVHVLPREMIPKVAVNDADLVVFDDSAVDLLGWYRLSTGQLRRFAGVDARMLPAAQSQLLRIFVEALLAGPRSAEKHARTGLAAAGLDVPPTDALRSVAWRLAEGQRAPRLPEAALTQGRDDLAEILRDVGRLRDLLRFATAYTEGAEVRWSEDSRAVHGETPAAKLLRTHGGRLVILDAAANVEELRALRSDLHIERLDVDDAGDARRILLFAKHATRTSLRDPRKRGELLDRWLRAVLERLDKRRVRRPVFVAYKSLVAELRAHRALVDWCKDDPRRSVRFAHYGALRGSNRFRKRDAVVTLCDPWWNGDDVTGRAEWLALDEPSYRVALATAELGQAHGRSRSVRRRRRLTHVHVGRLVPDGWAGGVSVEPIGGPPERTRGSADRITFAAMVGTLGGNRAAAERLGCSSSAIAGWRGGRRGLPRDILERTRDLLTGPPNQPASSGEGAARAARTMDAPAWDHRSKGCVHPERYGCPCLNSGEGAPAYRPDETVHDVPVHVSAPAQKGLPLAPERFYPIPAIPLAGCDGGLEASAGLSPKSLRLTPHGEGGPGKTLVRTVPESRHGASQRGSATPRGAGWAESAATAVALNAFFANQALAILEALEARPAWNSPTRTRASRLTNRDPTSAHIAQRAALRVRHDDPRARCVESQSCGAPAEASRRAPASPHTVPASTQVPSGQMVANPQASPDGHRQETGVPSMQQWPREGGDPPSEMSPSVSVASTAPRASAASAG